jgi:hypothetical protein
MSPRAHRIQQAIQAQQNTGMQHLLKGRIVKILLNLQLAYFRAHHSSNLNNPDIRWKAWRKKVIVAVVTFTLAVWNDRNAIYHGLQTRTYRSRPPVSTPRIQPT